MKIVVDLDEVSCPYKATIAREERCFVDKYVRRCDTKTCPQKYLTIGEDKMTDKCAVCNKDILVGDIFMNVEIDMRRLIYSESREEENFLMPDGPVHSKARFYICNICHRDIMISSCKDLATAIVKSRDMKTNNDEKRENVDGGGKY